MKIQKGVYAKFQKNKMWNELIKKGMNKQIAKKVKRQKDKQLKGYVIIRLFDYADNTITG
jgi:hypothetical protein